MSQNRPSDPPFPFPPDQTLYAPSAIYKSTTTLPISTIPPEFVRADLEFIGVDHSGPSFEARVFVNNPTADINTPPTEASGYAGSFNVFGHGGCFGDVGHCDVQERADTFDPRPSHPLAPMKKVVIATNAIRNAVKQGADINVTVVPLVKSWTDKTAINEVLQFDHINLITYR